MGLKPWCAAPSRVPTSAAAAVSTGHHVSDAFALGSTYSIELCRHFGVDPHAQTGIEPDEDETP
jgi:hypothetical protein